MGLDCTMLGRRYPTEQTHFIMDPGKSNATRLGIKRGDAFIMRFGPRNPGLPEGQATSKAGAEISGQFVQ